MMTKLWSLKIYKMLKFRPIKNKIKCLRLLDKLKLLLTKAKGNLARTLWFSLEIQNLQKGSTSWVVKKESTAKKLNKCMDLTTKLAQLL